MTDYLAIARECGAGVHFDIAVILFSATELSAFAERVRQDERERCAAVCEQRATAHFDWHDRHGYSPDLEWRVQEAKACAAAILAQQVPERAE